MNTIISRHSIAKYWQLLPTTILLLLSFTSIAHDARPAHLEISENNTGVLNVNWTRPVRDDRALNIHPVFPARCIAEGTPTVYRLQAAMHERWLLNCGPNELGGGQISISGLSNVISDVLLRYKDHHGSTHMRVLDRANPAFTIPVEATPLANIGSYYFKLGVSHILGGADHLLFVLCLLLLIQGFWQLVKTITAFTVAHSISLAAAILGYVHVPSTPVEAVIALSIVFLACELLRSDSRSFSKRLPWFIAAVFGLVHGLGFAGGLSEIGLPEAEIPLALLMFNIGVEAGQLMFVFAAAALLQGIRRVRLQWLAGIEKITSYAIGSIAAFWLIERINGFY